MRIRTVVVAGGGVAGLSLALLLARDGHRVTLVERDRFQVGAALDSPSWDRKGIPHFLQPHALIPRGRLELRRHLRDVYDALLAAGAHDVDLRRKLPGASSPDDVDLQYLAVRRPLIEWALRRAVAEEARIQVLEGASVTGVTVVAGRVTGVGVEGVDLEVEMLADAQGRRTAAPKWLENAGVPIAGVEMIDCSVIYYCRYSGPAGPVAPCGPSAPGSPRGPVWFQVIVVSFGEHFGVPSNVTL